MCVCVSVCSSAKNTYTIEFQGGSREGRGGLPKVILPAWDSEKFLGLFVRIGSFAIVYEAAFLYWLNHFLVHCSKAKFGCQATPTLASTQTEPTPNPPPAPHSPFHPSRTLSSSKSFSVVHFVSFFIMFSTIMASFWLNCKLVALAAVAPDTFHVYQTILYTIYTVYSVYTTYTCSCTHAQQLRITYTLASVVFWYPAIIVTRRRRRGRSH